MSGTILDVRLRMAVNFPPLPQVASSSLLLNLQADSLGLNSGDPVASWKDLSGNGYDFTQTGTSARPVYRSSGSYSYVDFAVGGGQWLNGQNWPVFDNRDSFAVFSVNSFSYINGHFFSPILTKQDFDSGAGWDTEVDYWMFIAQDYNNFLQDFQTHGGASFSYGARHVVSNLKNNNTDMQMFVDGVSAGILSQIGNPVISFSTVVPLVLGNQFTDPLYVPWQLYGVLVYSPVPNYYDRKQIEWWLSNKYGIPLQG